MTVVIEQQDGYSNDLLKYLATWQTSFTSGTNGFFNPTYTGSATTVYEQWGAGDTYDSADDAVDGVSAVLFDGEFTYTQATFNGEVNDFVFGSGLYYNDTTEAYEFDTEGLVLDLSNADVTSTYFTYTVYILSNYGSFEDTTIRGTLRPGLYSFLAEEGTEQIGTDSADVQYSFEGNDVLTGNGGVDTFVFDLDGLGYLTTAFEVIGDDTIADFDVSSETIIIGLNDTAYDTYDEIIALTTDSSAGAVIDLGDFGSITLTGVTVADLSNDNFAFV